MKIHENLTFQNFPDYENGNESKSVRILIYCFGFSKKCSKCNNSRTLCSCIVKLIVDYASKIQQILSEVINNFGSIAFSPGVILQCKLWSVVGYLGRKCRKKSSFQVLRKI